MSKPSSSSVPFFLLPQNVVVNLKIGCDVPSRDVCAAINGRLGFKIFPATNSLCHQTGGVSVSVFDSGQVVISGSRTSNQALITAWMLCCALNEALCRVDLRPRNFNHQNVVYSCALGCRIDMESFADYDDKNIKYSPEQFNGAHWKTCNLGKECEGFKDKRDRAKNKDNLCKGLHIGFVIFSTGKVITTMIKTFDVVHIAEQRLMKVLDFKVRDDEGDDEEEEKTETASRKRKSAIDSIVNSIGALRIDAEEQTARREENECVIMNKIPPFKPFYHFDEETGQLLEVGDVHNRMVLECA